MNINLIDIKLVPIFESVRREKMSDTRYFSDEFADYISNSRLKLINPEQNGCPSKYKEGFNNEKTISLTLGSSIHELLLQPTEFELGPDVNKPTSKLGLVIDRIRDLRKTLPIHKCILQACTEIHYYENWLTPFRIKSIIKLGIEYYLNSKSLSNNIILLSKKDREIVKNCITNLNSNIQVSNLLYPKDIFNDPIESYNEDAFFIDIKGTYKDKECNLKLKMKADNWTVDIENKVIVLNDLKTTGHSLDQFMGPGNSMEKFHYSRQFAMYLWILLQYCKKTCGYNSEEWKVKCNVIVVETILNNQVGVYSIDKKLLEEGRKEFCRLLKMVAYCEMIGYNDDIIFI